MNISLVKKLESLKLYAQPIIFGSSTISVQAPGRYSVGEADGLVHAWNEILFFTANLADFANKHPDQTVERARKLLSNFGIERPLRDRILDFLEHRDPDLYAELKRSEL